MALELKKAKGSTHRKKRLGCGNASGHGGTSTKGHKGAQSRSGYSRKLGFEGGQMPLTRRVPKKGFNNGMFKIEYQEIDLEKLNIFKDGSTVSYSELFEANLIKKLDKPFKILNNGKIEKKITLVLRKIKKGKKFFKYDKITANAQKNLEEIGGKVEYQ